jgi:hypothetical protein
LAATKPPLVPLSPQRARLQFERVLGLGAGAGAPPFRNVSDLPIVAPPPPAIPVLPGRPEDLAAMDGNSHLKRTRHRDVAATATLPPGYSDFELGPDAPRLFAVSGHSRVFRNRCVPCAPSCRVTNFASGIVPLLFCSKRPAPSCSGAATPRRCGNSSRRLMLGWSSVLVFVTALNPICLCFLTAIEFERGFFGKSKASVLYVSYYIILSNRRASRLCVPAHRFQM